MAPATPPQSPTAPARALQGAPPWHRLPGAAVVERLGVDPRQGLDGAAVEARQREHGANLIDEAPAESTWKKLRGLLADRMTIVLLAAAAVSAFVSREIETPVVILVVITLNTVINLVQERKAESSIQALRDLSVEHSRVRRQGRELDVEREALVPGDIVLLEAGATVPADGRLLEAVRLEVSESALTGESQPVHKQTRTLEVEAPSLGDRDNMLFMNTVVTRGRATLVVTETGMRTQMGAIATLLGAAERETTPLQRRIDQLAHLLTRLALIVVGVVFALGLWRGQSVASLLVTSVSLAVATIPEGLTAVVAFTLAMGASRLAGRGAIIKQLSAVETLGSTTQIATDKTGTLTLNQMTARRVHARGRTFRVSGEGYATDGKILSTDGEPLPDLTDALLAMSLCSDATIENGTLLGDPTEGALVVLAEKGGIDVQGLRRERPRVAEIPFDPANRFMATFHRFGEGRLRLFAKGASDALLARADSVLTGHGIAPLTGAERTRIDTLVEDLASEGMRTLVVAGRSLEGALAEEPARLEEAVSDLTLYALVGIVDPPRPEAAAALQVAARAGIAVHMITGDHLATASSIARALGIPGEAITGAQLEGLDDVELGRRVADFGVLARVDPRHKIRVVKALQARGNVVAMTGDGVNDAPALQQADIGVAMGITGTDVSKGAASMILTDDNFATIIAAIEEGRGIYANILKFVQFQLTTALGFVAIFLGSGLLGIAGGAPFTALQILWVNLIMDGPPAMSLGVDPAEPDAMLQPPRPVDEPLLTRGRLLGVSLVAALMAVGTLAVLDLGPRLFPECADPRGARTLGFTTFVLFQLFNLLNVRSRSRSVFTLQTLTNAAMWVALLAVALLQVLVVELTLLQRFFETSALSSGAWGLALLVGSSVLWVEELRKALVRRRERRRRSAGVRRGPAPSSRPRPGQPRS